ncbi:MAG: transcriptional repressor LexA [Actinobacteria bacterium]|nr:transcriptional repressor LexA [Actinomycetota bacterium]
MAKSENVKITCRQKAVLQKVYEFIAHNSYPPTARDIAKIMGFASPRSATDHFKALEKKGLIEKNSLARSIRLKKKAFELLGAETLKVKSGKMISFRPDGGMLYSGFKEISYLPLLGRIAAGNPILAYENIDEYIPVPESFTGAYGADFALRVRGDSMTGDHILDGDMIMVKSQNSAENGEIVVALINDEAVVKRFYKSKDKVELLSSNPDYPPIKISNKSGQADVKIIGRVVAVHRNI